jgi:hypothetical protein
MDAKWKALEFSCVKQLNIMEREIIICNKKMKV